MKPCKFCEVVDAVMALLALVVVGSCSAVLAYAGTMYLLGHLVLGWK